MVSLPLSTEGARLHVAVDFTSYTPDTLAELQFITGMLVSPYAALPATLEKAIAAATFEGDAGLKVWIRFVAERTHLFNRSTGDAIA